MTNGVEICLIYCEVWRKERSVGSKRQAEVSMDRASRDTYVFVSQATEDIGGAKMSAMLSFWISSPTPILFVSVPRAG